MSASGAKRNQIAAIPKLCVVGDWRGRSSLTRCTSEISCWRQRDLGRRVDQHNGGSSSRLPPAVTAPRQGRESRRRGGSSLNESVWKPFRVRSAFTRRLESGHTRSGRRPGSPTAISHQGEIGPSGNDFRRLLFGPLGTQTILVSTDTRRPYLGHGADGLAAVVSWTPCNPLCNVAMALSGPFGPRAEFGRLRPVLS